MLHPTLTASVELAVAHRILALEENLRLTLGSVPACSAVLDAREGAHHNTRRAALDRLAEANRLMPTTKTAPEVIRQAASAWAEMESLTWQLALSAGRVARREARRVPSRDITVADLEQEGMIGLHDAARRFEPDRGIRFAVYARWWVRAQLTKAIRAAGPFRISAGVYELHRNMHKLLAQHRREGIRPTTEALALALGVRPERLTEAMELDTLRPIEEPVELDAAPAISTLVDSASWTPEVAAAATEVAEWLRAAIHTSLAPREQRIMLARHGIDCEEASASEVAADLLLSSERIRQLEAQSRAVLVELFAREMNP